MMEQKPFRFFLLLQLLICPLLLWSILNNFQLLSDRREMLSAQSQALRDWDQFCQQFEYQKDFIILLHSPSLKDKLDQPECSERHQLESATDQLGQALEQDQNFANIAYKVDSPVFETQALFFLPPSQLQRLEHTLVEAKPFLDRLAQPLGLEQILLGLNQQPALNNNLVQTLGVFSRALRNLNASITERGDHRFESPLNDYEPDIAAIRHQPLSPGSRRFFIVLSSGDTYVVMAHANTNQTTKQSSNPQSASTKSWWWQTPAFSQVAQERAELGTQIQAMEALKAQVGKIQRSFPNLQVYVTGEAALENLELQEGINDIRRTAILAVALIVIVATSLVRCPRAIFTILACCTIGWVWQLGLVSLLGPLTILTAQHLIFYGVISLWWTTHTTLRFLLLQHSAQTRKSPAHQAGRHRSAIALLQVQRSWLREAKPFVIAVLAMWICLGWNHPALATLGFFTLLSLGTTLVQVGWLLPALLWLTFGPRFELSARQRRAPLGQVVARLIGHPYTKERRWSQLSQAVLILALLIGLGGLPRQTFESNLLELPGGGENFVTTENFLRPLGYSSMYGLVVARSLEESRQIAKRLVENPDVSRVEGLYQMWPSQLEEKRSQVAKIVALAQKLSPPQQNRERSTQELLQLRELFLTTESQLQRSLKLPQTDPAIQQQAQQLLEDLHQVRLKLDIDNPGPVEAGLSHFQKAFLSDLSFRIRFLKAQSTHPPEIDACVPAPLLLRTASRDGSYVLRVFPKHDPWNLQTISEFSRVLKSQGAMATGTPILLLEYLAQVRSSLLYGLSAFMALVLLAFAISPKRRATSAIFVRSCGVAAASLGWSAWLGLSLNALNIWFWLLALQLSWLHCLGRQSSDRRNWAEPFFLTTGLIALALSVWLLSTHLGVQSCAALAALTLALSLVIERRPLRTPLARISQD